MLKIILLIGKYTIRQYVAADGYLETTRNITHTSSRGYILKRYGKYTWRFLLGISISALFVWLAVRNVEFGEIARDLIYSDLRMILPFLVVLNLSYWAKGLRWSILLAPIHRAPAWALFPGVMIGFASNVLLPLQLGEFVRAWAVARQLNMEQATVIATIFLERIFDLLVMFFILECALLFFPTISSEVLTMSYILGGVCVALLILIAVCVRWTDSFVRLFGKGATVLPSSWQYWIVNEARKGALGLACLKEPRLLVGITATSFLQWGFMGLSIYIGFMAVGIAVPVSAGFIVLVLTSIGMTLPSGPGYIGTIQLAFVIGLRLYGVEATEAVAASIYFHFIAYAYSLIVGLYYLGRTGLTLTQAREVAEHVKQDATGAKINT